MKLNFHWTSCNNGLINYYYNSLINLLLYILRLVGDNFTRPNQKNKAKATNLKVKAKKIGLEAKAKKIGLEAKAKHHCKNLQKTPERGTYISPGAPIYLPTANSD